MDQDYKNSWWDRTVLETWDGQLQALNFCKRKDVFMELCEELTLTPGLQSAKMKEPIMV